GNTITLRVPVEEAFIPSFTVQVNLNGQAPRLDDQGQEIEGSTPRPAFAQGQLTLRVLPKARTLTVEAVPAAASLAPGAETSIAVTVTDANGAPVEGAELAVVVVDEAILALTGYTIADPLVTFYREPGAGIDYVFGRSTIQLVDPSALAAGMGGGRGGGGGDMGASAPAAGASADMAFEESAEMAAMPAAEAPAAEMPAPQATAAPQMNDGSAKTEGATTTADPDAPITVRTDFNPLALFAPAVTTDADGRATVEFKLPDNLTRYRVTVVAATEAQFGSDESNLTARLPLMVRPSAPRFLNWGDQFEFPVVLQNQTDAPLTVSVAMTTSNITLASPLGRSVEVPANDRVELRFPAAPSTPGTGRFQIAVSSDNFADAANGSLPIYTPATTEAFAVYG
ncbi:MAG: alpha-2-macroglobulin family protein, partial [Caldilineaceae bacterium]